MADKPNLLYIHTDQHTPNVLGCYGDKLVQTPNLDRLAANGAMFTNVYCPSPICVPSRMSMLTGRHPFQNEVWTNEHGLNSGIPTLAHSMGAGGYRPVLIGRLHSLGPDQLRGYTERLVGDHESNYLGGSGTDRGFLQGTNDPERISLERSGAGQSAYQVHDEVVAAAAIDYLNNVGIDRRSGQSDEPFNLTVGFMLPHAPFVARQEDYQLYEETMTLPAKPRPMADERHPFLSWWRQETEIEAVSEAEVLRARTAYWALVTRVDAMVGQIMRALEENGLLEDTLIVYTSDHGDMLGEHGLWWKHVFYEESVKVPLIVSWPGRIPVGQRCDRVVSALDVNATILAALDAPPLPHSEGRDLLGLIDGRVTADAWEDVAYSEYCSDEFAPAGGCYQRMIRRGDWKLIYYHGQPDQLFNLADDPEELNDLSDSPTAQAIKESLIEQLLREWDPEEIMATMAAKKLDANLLKQWAQETMPDDICRWDLKPDMNYLDNMTS